MLWSKSYGLIRREAVGRKGWKAKGLLLWTSLNIMLLETMEAKGSQSKETCM